MKKLIQSLIVFVTFSCPFFLSANLHAEEEGPESKFENCVIKDFIASHKNSIENCEFESLEIDANLSGSLAACKEDALALLKDEFSKQNFSTISSKLLALGEMKNKLQNMQLSTLDKIQLEIQSAGDKCRENGNLNYKGFKVKIESSGKIIIHKVEQVEEK